MLMLAIIPSVVAAAIIPAVTVPHVHLAPMTALPITPPVPLGIPALVLSCLVNSSCAVIASVAPILGKSSTR
jgi:hypothetical protein